MEVITILLFRLIMTTVVRLRLRLIVRAFFSLNEGGTLDVTVHEIKTDGNMKEIYQVTGGPYGGTKVNEEFVSLLKRFFGTSVVEQFQESFPGEWLEMINEFEMKKRGRRAFDGEVTRLRLPRAFTAMIPNTNVPTLARGYSDVQFMRNEYFCLQSTAMKKLFEPVVNGIVEHLKSLLKNDFCSKLQFLFIVGGFAQSTLLQNAIKKNFSSR